MTKTTWTRRRLLDSLTVTGTLVAGCLDDQFESEDRTGSADTRTERSTDDEDGSDESSQFGNLDRGNDQPLYQQWAPSREEYNYAYNYARRLGFAEVDHRSIRAVAEALDGPVVKNLRSRAKELDMIGVSTDDIDRSLEMETGLIATGSFDVEGVRASIEDAEYAGRTEQEGYTVYDSVVVDDSPGLSSGLEGETVALDGSTLLVVDTGAEIDAEESSSNEKRSVETFLDVAAGTIEPLAESHEDVRALGDAIDRSNVPTRESSFFLCQLYEPGMTTLPEETGGLAASWRFGKRQTEIALGFVAGDDVELTERPIRSYVENERSIQAYEPTVSTREDVVLVEGSIETDRFNFLQSPRDELETETSTPLRPLLHVQIDHDREDSEVVVTVTSVDRADAMEIRVDGEVIRTAEEVNIADTFTLNVEPGEEIVIVGKYEGQEAVITTYDV